MSSEPTKEVRVRDVSPNHLVLTWWIRRVARTWSVASLGIFLLLILGEGIHPTSPTESLGLLFYPLGIGIGMIVGWWREGLGGSITTASLFAFYLIHLADVNAWPKGWAWIILAAPGFLFLFCWYRSRAEDATKAKEE
jgi:hypothetical protein